MYLQEVQEPPRPEDSALRVTLLGELVAGWGFSCSWGFPRSRLYVEYRILYDPGVWRLVPPQQGFREGTCPRPGIIRVRFSSEKAG